MSSGYNEVPSRPSLPPLAIAALFAWISVLVVEELSWLEYLEELSSLQEHLPAVMFLMMPTVILLARAIMKRNLTLVLIVTACVIAAICSTLHWGAWHNDIRMLPELLEAHDALELDITSDPARHNYGTISNAEHRIGAHVVKMRVLWPDGTGSVSPGHRIVARGALSSIKPDDSGHWNHQNGYVGMMRVSSFEAVGRSPSLQGVVASFRDASFERVAQLEGDAAGMLGGILLGNKTLFNGSQLELSFRTTGLAHLMAVSGTHLAIVTALIALVIGKTRLRRGRRNALVLVALLSYVAITGFAPSAMRACTMCSVALLLGTLKRRTFALNALALCAFVFIGMSPAIVFSMGFQLSVLSVLGLVVFARLAQHWMARIIPKAPEWLVASVSATLAASCATLPVTTTAFAQLPLVSPLANILAVPLITAALCIGVIALLTCAVCEPLGMLVLHVSGTLAKLCTAIVRWLSDIPGACMPVSSDSPLLAVLFALMLVMLWIIWPLPGSARQLASESPGFVRTAASTGRMLCVCVLPLVLVLALGFGRQLVALPASDSRLVMLDVGQGDALLIQSKDAAVLVDTGEESDVLIRELAEQGIQHLDAVFITHKDSDHCGALQKLAGTIAVDHVYIHEDLLDEDFEEKVLESARWVTGGNSAEGVTADSCFDVGDFALTVISPEHGGTSANDDSLVLLLEYDIDHDDIPETRGILTGDAEHQALARVYTEVGDVDFIKVAHHGSKDGATDEQLETLKPEIALISVGADNRYGHPNQETIDQYERIDARIYRTDGQGAVSICFEKQGYSVFTERAP